MEDALHAPLDPFHVVVVVVPGRESILGVPQIAVKRQAQGTVEEVRNPRLCLQRQMNVHQLRHTGFYHPAV